MIRFYKTFLLILVSAKIMGVKAQLFGGQIIKRSSGIVTSLNCNAGSSGWINKGILPAGLVSSSISYTGGNGQAYTSIEVPSTGVAGLTAKITGGSLQQGTGILQVNISGNTTEVGTAQFTISIAGQTCTFQRPVGCRAFISSSDNREFLCHNLGADTNIDPNNSSMGWALNGAYIQWGQRGPNQTGDSRIDWKTAANNGTIGFSMAPTAVYDNFGAIPQWNTSPFMYGSGAWRDAQGKTVQDPCPSGYRLPTKEEWQGLISNNTITWTGTWNNVFSNYSSMIKIGGITLPASGYRLYLDGTLENHGHKGAYWAADDLETQNAWYLHFNNSDLFTPFTGIHKESGLPVRCIQGN